MISPVNSDKPINTTTEQSGRSNSSQKTAESTEAPSKQQAQAASANEATVDVDQARRLFDIENNGIEPPKTQLNNADEARSVLQSVVQQIGASPETAAKAQAAKASSPLSGILQSAPA